MNRVLLIDDNTFFRTALRDILHFKFPSMIIEEAADGSEGLKKVMKFHPQLIFLDTQVPGEDGFKLACRIKAEHPNTIMVIFTSYELEEYRAAALQAGIDHVIPKNLWSGQGIVALVEAILSRQNIKPDDTTREKQAAKKPLVTIPQTKGERKKGEKKSQ